MIRHPDARKLRPGEEAQLVATGDCYEAAFLYQLENPGATLVQAVCLIGSGEHEGLEHGHAWCEVEEELPSPPGWDGPALTMTFCVDKSNGRDIRLPVPFYYMGGRPTQIHRYTSAEALGFALDREVYGPWELDVPR